MTRIVRQRIEAALQQGVLIAVPGGFKLEGRGRRFERRTIMAVVNNRQAVMIAGKWVALSLADFGKRRKMFDRCDYADLSPEALALFRDLVATGKTKPLIEYDPIHVPYELTRAGVCTANTARGLKPTASGYKALGARLFSPLTDQQKALLTDLDAGRSLDAHEARCFAALERWGLIELETPALTLLGRCAVESSRKLPPEKPRAESWRQESSANDPQRIPRRVGEVDDLLAWWKISL